MDNDMILKALARNSELIEASLIQALKKLEGVAETDEVRALLAHAAQMNATDKHGLVAAAQQVGIEDAEGLSRPVAVPPVIVTLMQEAVDNGESEFRDRSLSARDLTRLRHMLTALKKNDLREFSRFYRTTDQWALQLISQTVINWLSDNMHRIQPEESKS